MEHAVTGIRERSSLIKVIPPQYRGGAGVVGLLFAGAQFRNVSYFTHSFDLIADIKEATGPKGVTLLS